MGAKGAEPAYFEQNSVARYPINCVKGRKGVVGVFDCPYLLVGQSVVYMLSGKLAMAPETPDAAYKVWIRF
jgi:hypothetical protein